MRRNRLRRHTLPHRRANRFFGGASKLRWSTRFSVCGPGNFEQVSGQWHTTHNSLTLMSSEGGVPAMILYCLILWCGFKNLGATRRLVRGQRASRVLAGALLASLAGYAVGSLFLSEAYMFLPYILVGYTAALFSITRTSSALSRGNELARQLTGKKKLQGKCQNPKWLAPTSHTPSLTHLNVTRGLRSSRIDCQSFGKQCFAVQFTWKVIRTN